MLSTTIENGRKRKREIEKWENSKKERTQERNKKRERGGRGFEQGPI
jgi:hypothetical protein